MLYVVATPIGNLGDIGARALEVLSSVDLVLAEDTRSFQKLASHYNIQTKVLSYHEQNESSRSRQVLEMLNTGSSVALTSERGTPAISDPGYRLLAGAREQGIKVSPIPGACAAVAALSVCGFEIERFQFLGFVPVKEGKRKAALNLALESGMTSVFYESPYRVVRTLEAINDLDSTCDICLARELTKLHEEVLHGAAGELLATLKSRPSIKGEFVLVIRRK